MHMTKINMIPLYPHNTSPQNCLSLHEAFFQDFHGNSLLFSHDIIQKHKREFLMHFPYKSSNLMHLERKLMGSNP